MHVLISDRGMNKVLSIDELSENISNECRKILSKEYGKLEIEYPKKRIEKYAEILSALSNPIRLSIIWILLQYDLPVCVLVALLRREQTLISHHLSILREYNIVSERVRGKFRYYSINEKAVKIIKDLFKHLEALLENLERDNSKIE